MTTLPHATPVRARMPCIHHESWAPHEVPERIVRGPLPTAPRARLASGFEFLPIRASDKDNTIIFTRGKFVRLRPKGALGEVRLAVTRTRALNTRRRRSQEYSPHSALFPAPGYAAHGPPRQVIFYIAVESITICKSDGNINLA